MVPPGTRSFEAFLARSISQGAAVHLQPSRDPDHGGIVFHARLVGPDGETFDGAAIENVVVRLAACASRPNEV